MAIKFGTDGWRAVISEEFTFENVRKVAQAIAEKVVEEDTSASPSMVIGYDTRFLSDRYAAAIAEVFAANGIRVWLTERDASTPLVSYAIVTKKTNGGVMITASHNPPRYNGIKLKAAYGGSASPEDSKDIERRILAHEAAGVEPKRVALNAAMDDGAVQMFDPLPEYEAHIRTLVNFDTIRAANLSVCVDTMYGAGRTYMRYLLEQAGCTVKELRGETNPGFNGSHPEPLEKHLQPLMDEMATGQYQIGLATDGDADRIGAVDPGSHFVSPRFIDPHCIMALLLEHLVHERKMTGSVVKTVSTTQMLNRLADRYNLTIHETPVGFNHISDLMISEDVLIGGEESGGISILGHIPEGDGLLMGLLLVELIASRQKTLAELLADLMGAEDVGVFCYARHDQPVEPFDKATLVKYLMEAKPDTLGGVPVAHASDKDGVKFILQDESWLLIRPSGTEPVLRIYSESRSDEQVQALLKEGATLAQAQIAKM